jgi:hypothetical protein
MLNRAWRPGLRARARRVFVEEEMTVVELVVLAALAFAAMIVVGVLTSVFGLVMWVVFLPFRIFGWMLKGIGFLLALPFIVLFAVIAALALGAGMIMFLLPVIPFALIALGAWWLVRRRPASTASVTH